MPLRFKFKYADAALIGALLSQFFLGVYVMTFALYILIKRARKSPLGPVGYGIIVLFSGTVLTITLDSVQQFYTVRMGAERAPWLTKVNAMTSLLSITLDFLSQVILIYRCWSVWGHAPWVAIPPGLLAIASWACGLTVTLDLSTVTGSYRHVAKGWWMPLGGTSMGLSLGVNAVVSGLMISRICPLAFVASALLESAVALFIAQLVYMVLYHFGHPAFALVAGPVTIIYGLNCTAIMVRVAMNQSYEVAGVSTQNSFMVFAPGMIHKTEADLHLAGVSSSTEPGEGDGESGQCC